MPACSANEGREADYLYPLLDSFGVPRERVTLENRSRNTYENAVFAKELAKPKPGERWLLVTSALHMPRAIGCFRRAGFPVEAYPVDWHSQARLAACAGLRISRAGSAAWITPRTNGSACWHIGLRGRTSELFPSPVTAH